MKPSNPFEKSHIIAMNSDTIGGLFVKYNDIEGLKELFNIKKRALDKVLQVYISDLKMLRKLGVSGEERRVIKELLPGPFTLIVKSQVQLPFITKDGYIGIRFTENKRINKLIDTTGPLAATSINISGKKVEKLDYYKKKYTNVALGNMKNIKSGFPSTVLKYLGNGNYQLLRKGAGNIKKLQLDTAIGSDHGGYKMKEYLKDTLMEMGISSIDMGTFSEASVDYPDYAQMVGGSVQRKEVRRGILICGTGIGMSIAANRFKNVRAALCHSEEYARLARQHNNANIIALGGRFLPFKKAKTLLKIFYTTPFDGGRHLRRIKKIEKI